MLFVAFRSELYGRWVPPEPEKLGGVGRRQGDGRPPAGVDGRRCHRLPGIGLLQDVVAFQHVGGREARPGNGQLAEAVVLDGEGGRRIRGGVEDRYLLPP